MQVHPRTLRLPSRTGAPSHSGLSTGGPNGLQFRFSQGGCQTHQGPSEGGTAKLRRLRAMPVAHAPQCMVFKLFRLAGGRGSFATVKSFSVACIVAVAVGAASPVAVRAQGDAAAPAPAVDPSWLRVDTVTKTATFQLVAGLTGLKGSLRGFGLSSQAVVGGHSCGETLTSRERGVPSGRWRGLVRPARRRSAARSTRSQGGGLRFPLFVHTTVGEKPDEYDWWEDHVPTRCTWRYLAAVGASRARAVGLAR